MEIANLRGKLLVSHPKLGERAFSRVGRIPLAVRAHRTDGDDATQPVAGPALQPIGKCIQRAQAERDFGIRQGRRRVVQVGRDPARTRGPAHRQDAMIRREQGQGEAADRATGAENEDGRHVGTLRPGPIASQ